MSVVPPHSCIHYQNGTYVAGCAVCEMRQARSWRLDGRHYRARQIITADDLDESTVIDDQTAVNNRPA